VTFDACRSYSSDISVTTLREDTSPLALHDFLLGAYCKLSTAEYWLKNKD